MANFNINNLGSFAIGTAASDTFNISHVHLPARYWDWTETTRSTSRPVTTLLLDGGAGNDSFNFGGGIGNYVLGGEGNDTAFFASGHQNNVYGGAGNDWIGIGGGGASYTERVRRRRRRRLHRR